ncbi:5-hydroxytryptamine receptor 2C-like [Asterias amurensis]|uniref:5-hydroxytryptamine receptor 2C-like n=1 Tax=Asterias amurensis TaxID=7602 RepID=UPI003AB58EF7
MGSLEVVNSTMTSLEPFSSNPSVSNASLPYDTAATTTEGVMIADIQIPNQNWMFLFLLLVIFVSVVGNLLVCLAIMTERALHSATNYFLFSMAIADLMVALLVMPIGLVKYLLGVWLLGPTMCNIWVSLDVLCCTSSIMHICTISLDRYLAICNPFTTQHRSRFQTPGKIIIVWLISITLCSPIFVLGFVSTSEVLNVEICIMTNRLFAIYGSIIAFFIPLVIVIVTYGRTAYILNKKARAFGSSNMSRNPSDASRGDTSPHRSSIFSKAVICYQQCTDTNGNNATDSCTSDIYEKITNEELQLNMMNNRMLNLKADTLTLDSSPRILRSPSNLERPGLEMRRSTSGMSGKGYRAKINTERRASKVLGLVFVVFLIGWTPFFITNFFSAVCSSCDIDPTYFSIFEWLGWASSMVNPFIYTIFNKTFQRTFWKLITCRWRIKKKHRHQKLKRASTIIEIKQTNNGV